METFGILLTISAILMFAGAIGGGLGVTAVILFFIGITLCSGRA